MFGLFSQFGPFGMSEKTRKEHQEREARLIETRWARVEPWRHDLPWKPTLTLQASSWTAWNLFGVEPTINNNVNCEHDIEKKFITSPTGKYLYCEKLLPRGALLQTLQGSRRGDVMFDGPVCVPSLHEKSYDDNWREEPWMSMTPMEVMTQRPGTRLAKGHTVIAGLGLGWGLFEVLRKRSVKKVTLIEISQELVDWLLPRIMDTIRLRAGESLPKLEVVVGDAKEILKTFEADVALVDIFHNYGGNTLYHASPNIKTVWCWGAALLADRERGWY